MSQAGNTWLTGCCGEPLPVEKQPGVDTVRLTRQVEKALDEITATLPDGIKADNLLFRQADFIETSIYNVKKVLLEAVAVVAIVLFAFLLNVRTTAISLTAIPVSILVTAIVAVVMVATAVTAWTTRTRAPA